MSIQRVSVVGSGVMGKQIAVMAAAHEYDVMLYDQEPTAIAFSKQTVRTIIEQTVESSSRFASCYSNVMKHLRVTCDPATAADNCQLLIEALPEKLHLKLKILKQFNTLCPVDTIFATNSSLIIPSKLAGAVKFPENLVSLHFAVGNSVIEIMPHEGTSKETVQQVNDFAEVICETVLTCHQEHSGHVLTNLLMAMNGAALNLLSAGVATPQEIDQAWKQATKARYGPFEGLDHIGLDTALKITEIVAFLSADPQHLKSAQLLRDYVAKGQLGKKSGSGFYFYPVTDQTLTEGQGSPIG